MINTVKKIPQWLYDRVLSVPFNIKVIGVGLLPVLILGFTLNYWITISLSDWLSYILSEVRVQAAMAVGARSMTFVTILSAIASILFSLLLAHILAQPILALVDMAEQVASGNLSARAPVWAKDEIGKLAIAVNTMTDNLVATQEDLARKNRSLNVINQVALAGDRQEDIHDILYTILRHVIEFAGLKIGWVYLRDPEKNTLHLASWFGIAEESAPAYLDMLADPPCDCQKNFQQDRFDTRAEIRVCERLSAFPQLGIGNTHVAIPLAAREQHLGFINLLCEKGVPIPDDDMKILSSIGAQVSEIVSNAWLHQKLVEKEAARQALLISLVEAQEDERKRLARELHDGAGQALTNMLVRLKMIENKAILPQVKADLQFMQNLMSETIEQLRTLSHQLRPAALEEFGLPLALETLATDMSKSTGMDMSYHCGVKNNELPDEIEVMFYRIAQEGLTNIVRHSHASHFSLLVERKGQRVTMSIEDDGIGFDAAILGNDNKRHLGLISMKERAEILGGDLDVYTALGKGTTLQVYVPMNNR